MDTTDNDNDNWLVRLFLEPKISDRSGANTDYNFVSRLKKYIGYFNGVSTKYLNNYLTWNNVVEYSKVYLDNKISLLFEASAKALMTIKSLGVSNRPEIPILV